MINLDSLKAMMRTEKVKTYWLPKWWWFDGDLPWYNPLKKNHKKKKHIQVKLNSDVSKTYSFLMMPIKMCLETLKASLQNIASLYG